MTPLRDTTCIALENLRGAAHTAAKLHVVVFTMVVVTPPPLASPPWDIDQAQLSDMSSLGRAAGWSRALQQLFPTSTTVISLAWGRRERAWYCSVAAINQKVLPGCGSEASCRWQEPSPALAWSPDGHGRGKARSHPVEPSTRRSLNALDFMEDQRWEQAEDIPRPRVPPPRGEAAPRQLPKHLLACTLAAFTPSQTQAG